MRNKTAAFLFYCVAPAVPISFLCGCGSAGQSSNLKSLAITPTVASVSLGGTIQLKAVASYSDGSSKDITPNVRWSSTDYTIAKVDASGLVTFGAVGEADVSAAFGNLSVSAHFTVGKPSLASIAISPAAPVVSLGGTQQLSAVGVLSDKSTQDLTSTVTWSSSDPTIADVSSTGLATPKSLGTTTITATSDSVSATAQLTVTTAALAAILVTSDHSAIPVGSTAQLSAQGVYGDGSTKDLTSSVTWTSSPAGLTSVSAAGLATAQAVGSATITATLGSIKGSASLSVTPAVLSSIAITSNNSTMPLGTTQQLIASGAYSDGTVRDLTTSVTWISQPANFVEISAGGLATADAIGTSQITATSGTITGSAFLTVSAAALISISISPGDPHIPLGGSNQLIALGNYTDGTSQNLVQDLTWNVDQAAVATIDPTGLATGLQIGATGIEASSGGIVGTATLTVQPVTEINYFTSGNVDSTIRISNPGVTGGDLCAMIYVFDQDQQLSECCGCVVRRNSLRTLSLQKDLVSNPLTGVQSTNGTIVLVPADFGTNTTCDATQITPAGTAVAWATHLQSAQGGRAVVTETPFSTGVLGDQQAATLPAQCSFVRELGSGQGTCGCGLPQ